MSGGGNEVFFLHYLDNAATTLVPEEVVQAMEEALRRHSGNPSSQYPFGQEDYTRAVQKSGDTGRTNHARAVQPGLSPFV